jgi:hypothetical protein
LASLISPIVCMGRIGNPELRSANKRRA